MAKLDEVMKYFLFLKKILLKMLIFKPIVNFFENLNPKWLRIPRGYWPYKLLSDTLILRSLNVEKFRAEIVMQ